MRPPCVKRAYRLRTSFVAIAIHGAFVTTC
jgi:hypothetical protein